eukprot:664605-Amphidinium_carterae.2
MNCCKRATKTQHTNCEHNLKTRRKTALAKRDARVVDQLGLENEKEIYVHDATESDATTATTPVQPRTARIEDKVAKPRNAGRVVRAIRLDYSRSSPDDDESVVVLEASS